MVPVFIILVLYVCRQNMDIPEGQKWELKETALHLDIQKIEKEPSAINLANLS